MSGRFSRGWSMARTSLAVLRRHPTLALFPILSGSALLLVLGVIVSSLLPQVGSTSGGSIWRWVGDGTGSFWPYAAALGFLYVIVAIATFFNVALIHCVLRAHAGDNPSIGGGLAAATALLPQILGWALVATTVGVLLNLVQDALKNYLGFLGGLFGGLLELSWAVTTYFVIPVLVTEKVGPVTAAKRSAAILRSKWGESLAGEARIGLLGALFFLVFALVAAGGLAIILSHGATSIGSILVALGVAGGIATLAIFQTLGAIFQSGVYLYATTGRVPPTLDPELVQGAFRNGRKPHG